MNYKEVLLRLWNLDWEKFTSRGIAKEFDISLGHASQDLSRCWKMGFLNRRREGRHYLYELSKQGKNYLHYSIFEDKQEKDPEELLEVTEYYLFHLLIKKNELDKAGHCLLWEILDYFEETKDSSEMLDVLKKAVLFSLIKLQTK